MNAMDRISRSELMEPGHSFGKFYLVQTIGEGGTSKIFKALQQPINRLVALKIPSFVESGAVLTPDEFLSEAILMAKLEHPNVVRIYDFGVAEDRAFICMEYVEGLSLLEQIRTQGALSLSATLSLGVQILDALIHSHSQEVLHLDLSPANVLIAKSGLVKLLDFGMAGKNKPKDHGKVFGTPAFLSPEHIAGKTGTPQSDLFSFGSLLYFAGTGKLLFDPGTENAQLTTLLRSIESARAQPPEGKLSCLPSSLAQIIRLALTGTPPEKLSLALKEAWMSLEGDGAPRLVLFREMEMANSAASLGDLPTGEKLKSLYHQLRESGRHREAMALLEKAIRREPENKALVELLATPPTKPKTIPATMEVKESQEPLQKPKERRRLPYILGFIVLVLVGYLIWEKLEFQKTPVAVKSNVEEEKRPLPSLSLAEPITVDTQKVRAVMPKAQDNFRSTPASKQHAPEKKPALTISPSTPANPNGSELKKVRSPALAIVGPAGIKVSLNDSIEWVSPNPTGGWTLNPGLINLTLTLPGSPRPINSSLFISNDSLYLIQVDVDGGFSVTRQLR